MILLDDLIIDEAIRTCMFACNLDVCHGQCCVEGDLGPLVTSAEISRIEEFLPHIRLQMPVNARNYLTEKGLVENGFQHQFLTIMPGCGPCIFDFREKRTHLCLLQWGYQAALWPQLKPLSCRLFPLILRNGAGGLRHLDLITAWECHSCFQGTMPIFRFLRQPLIEALGVDLYQRLCIMLDNGARINPDGNHTA